MKQLLLALLLLINISCLQNTISKKSEETVREFISLINEQNSAKYSKLISNEIKVREGDYIIASSQVELIANQKWKACFNPYVTIENLEAKKETVVVTLSAQSERLIFLGCNPLKYKQKFELKNGKIVQIDLMEYLEVDWDMWNANRDSLTNWIDETHPELTGFVFDISEQGCHNYMEAIKLYSNRKEP